MLSNKMNTCSSFVPLECLTLPQIPHTYSAITAVQSLGTEGFQLHYSLTGPSPTVSSSVDQSVVRQRQAVW